MTSVPHLLFAGGGDFVRRLNFKIREVSVAGSASVFRQWSTELGEPFRSRYVQSLGTTATPKSTHSIRLGASLSWRRQQSCLFLNYGDGRSLKNGYRVSKSYTVAKVLYCWSYIVYDHPQTRPKLRMPNFFLYLHNITEYTLLERYKYFDRKRHLRLSQRCYWAFKSTGKRLCAVASAIADLSKDHTALMFRIKHF